MDLGWPEILIIAVVVLVLFGSKKMPDAARSLGRSLRILKTEVKGLHDEDESAKPPATAVVPELTAGNADGVFPTPAGRSATGEQSDLR
jgi:sec-independent protein translocase protein TatA